MGDAGLTAAGEARQEHDRPGIDSPGRPDDVAAGRPLSPLGAHDQRGREHVRIGVPKEVKNHEYRVAITPIGVHELVAHGHEVFVEKDAGVGSQVDDAEYVAAGATIVDSADDAWGEGEMVLKVKEPIAEEYERMREGQVLFTFLHLAADKPLTEELTQRKVTGIAYETVQLPSGSLPLLYPMSEVAGCLAPQVGAHELLKRPRWPWGAARWRRRRGQREGRRDRCRGLRPERRQHRARHGGRRHPAGHRPGQAAAVVLALQQPGARPGVLEARHPPAGARGGPGDRGGADPGREGPDAGEQRPGRRDEAGVGARRHRRRPGRVLRGHPPHDARRPDVRRAQLVVLLRGQHAGRRTEHLDLRAHQRDPALHRRAGGQGLGAGVPRRPLALARA